MPLLSGGRTKDVCGKIDRGDGDHIDGDDINGDNINGDDVNGDNVNGDDFNGDDDDCEDGSENGFDVGCLVGASQGQNTLLAFCIVQFIILRNTHSIVEWF